jgi:hypothetical protein
VNRYQNRHGPGQDLRPLDSEAYLDFQQKLVHMSKLKEERGEPLVGLVGEGKFKASERRSMLYAVRTLSSGMVAAQAAQLSNLRVQWHFVDGEGTNSGAKSVPERLGINLRRQ